MGPSAFRLEVEDGSEILVATVGAVLLVLLLKSGGDEKSWALTG